MRGVNIILLCLCVFSVRTNAQDVCSCNRFFNSEDVFDPELILTNGIKEAIITLKPKEKSGDGTQHSQLDTAEICRFNSNGYVETKIEYSVSTPSSITTYSRNTDNQIVKSTHGSLTQRSTDENVVSKSVEEFWYKNHLQIASRYTMIYGSGKHEVTHESYLEYDSLDRLIKTAKVHYYSWSIDTTLYLTNYDKLHEAKSIFYKEGRPWIITTKIYNEQNQLLKVRDSSLSNIWLVTETDYLYNDEGRLINSVVTQPNLGHCLYPFTDTYYYLSSGLLQKIVHSYNDSVCEIGFSYK